MKPFFLVETITKDKLIHQGIFFKPSNPGRKALLWVHGLTSTFYSGVKRLDYFTELCEKEGFGFASFNNRGHDIVTGIKRVDKRKVSGTSYVSAGAGVENFKECIFDIESGVDFLVEQGFSEIFVIGQSTGANKVTYFAGKKNHPKVAGVILASPVSDRLSPGIPKNKIKTDLSYAQEMINKGKGDEITTSLGVFPMTPNRFLSCFAPNSLEDQFDYGDPRPRMSYFSKIKKPLLVLIGNKDEHMDRPAKQFLEIFDAYHYSTNYKSVILKNMNHTYSGKEKEFVNTIIDWVKKQ